MTWFISDIDGDTALGIDRLIAEGAVASRSDAVRRGLELLLDEHRRRAVGEAIVDGYRRIPQTEDDCLRSKGASVRMITEEPWRARRQPPTGQPSPSVSALRADPPPPTGEDT